MGCRGSCSAGARERWRSGASLWTLHGDEEVAAEQSSGSCGTRKQGSGEGTRAGLEEEMTRGRGRSRRWTTAICTVAAGGGAAPAAEQKSREAGDKGGSEEEEEGEKSKD
jgi:hypothetical protein